MANVKVITESLLSAESDKDVADKDSHNDIYVDIEKDYDYYDDFYVKKDPEEKPEVMDRGQLIDSIVNNPELANY